MWRALFLALGVTTVIIGLESLTVDKVVLKPSEQRINSFGQVIPAPPREIVPPEWAPWALLSAGAVVVLYSYTIPSRVTAGP